MKFYRYLLCFLLLSTCLFAEEAKPTVCLNMIVKNESKVITRCLSSLKHLIDYWVILDTGSTDGTQQIIKEFMKDVPGELHEDPFRNFEYSRNKALDFAKGKGDYILVIDADEVFVCEPNFKFPFLNKDFYYVMTDYNGMEYARVQLFSNHLNYRWKGVLHEAVYSKEAITCETLIGLRDFVRTDGARSNDSDKYKKDAQVLEDALKDDPNNSRYTFYLAQSYRDANMPEKALENYQKRIAQGGWDQEVFWAMYEAANMQKAKGDPPDVFIPSYLKAYHARPTRIEPLYDLAAYYREKGDYMSGYLIADIAYEVPKPTDVLFLQKWMYEIGIPMELAICSYGIGKHQRAGSICLEILKKKDLPPTIQEYAERLNMMVNMKALELCRNNMQCIKNPPTI